MICKEQVGVVADLPQVAQYSKSLILVELGLNCLLVGKQVLLIEIELSLGQVAEDNELIPVWQLALKL